MDLTQAILRCCLHNGSWVYRSITLSFVWRTSSRFYRLLSFSAISENATNYERAKYINSNIRYHLMPHITKRQNHSRLYSLLGKPSGCSHQSSDISEAWTLCSAIVFVLNHQSLFSSFPKSENANSQLLLFLLTHLTTQLTNMKSRHQSLSTMFGTHWPHFLSNMRSQFAYSQYPRVQGGHVTQIMLHKPCYTKRI